MKVSTVNFPMFSGVRCLMMPYIQGDPASIPSAYGSYSDIIGSIYIKKGDIGYLTIDESFVVKGHAHRSSRAKTKRAIHTEAGRIPGKVYAWGGGGWGNNHRVTLDRSVQVLLANNIDNSCAVWDAEHEDTSLDGDLGHVSQMYPYSSARMMKSGEVFKIGILTPHESLPVVNSINRQFLRIVSSGVYGFEPYFTTNPLVPPIRRRDH